MPAGSGRGIGGNEVGEVVLETGTEGRESKVANAAAEGPKGEILSISESEEKMEVPSSAWEVTTTRGGGRSLDVMFAWSGYIW